MKENSYNGWTNYETWVTALWIDNDYQSYQYRCELVEKVKKKYLENSDESQAETLHDCACRLASSLKDWIEEQNPLAENANVFTDLLNSALSEIDWQEIAENFLAE
jgi:hypothetical protein